MKDKTASMEELPEAREYYEARRAETRRLTKEAAEAFLRNNPPTLPEVEVVNIAEPVEVDLTVNGNLGDILLDDSLTSELSSS